jgi:hypothetical protein
MDCRYLRLPRRFSPRNDEDIPPPAPSKGGHVSPSHRGGFRRGCILVFLHGN